MQKRPSRLRTILVALGSSVGLANIWGFPYKYQSGGLVFLISFLIFTIMFLFLSLPAEFAVGRMSRNGTIGAYEKAFKSSKKSGKAGRIVGYITLLGTLLIVIGYCSILAYILKSLFDSLNNQIFESTPQAWFNGFANIPNKITVYHAVIIFLAVWVCIGHTPVIKRIYRDIMPLFFILLIVLAINLASRPGASDGYDLMFKYNPDTLNIKTILYAMGEALFSLSIAGSAMIVAGGDLSDEANLMKLSTETGIFDTLVGLAASLSIIPAVSIFNLTYVNGPSLVFVSLPAIFQNINFGRPIAIFFYLCIVFAGVLSIAVFFEAIADSILKRFHNLSRINVFFIIGIAVFLLGLNLETVSEFTSYMNLILLIIIPVGATIGAICWFYVMDKETLLAEINKSSKFTYTDRWYKLGKYLLVPLSVLLSLIAIVLTIAH